MPRPSRAFDTTTRLRPNDQSLDDQYGEPENFLEISVGMPVIRNDRNGRYADYEIECFTNIPLFKLKHSSVRRRYSDFEWLRDMLTKESERVNIPPLPGKVLFNRFDKDVLKSRHENLQRFLQIVAGHPLLQTGSKVLIPFIQDPTFNRKTYEM
ncbi:Sorting nexin-3 [Coemansia sp. RSA 2337]|nr:Sorting nexin-3 [Coemansia sp. S16]KAJ2112960.1 Sorting nexin-3 [Coemansia sp. RSA 922]KAJ2447966.1 Sorting nexin-3 [Coemansia sp. RSA 2337]